MQEMAALFEDEVFNIGCDETSVVGPCTLNSTFSFERQLLNTIQNQFNKTPAGWEEVRCDSFEGRAPVCPRGGLSGAGVL
jgi:hypothetical protein